MSVVEDFIHNLSTGAPEDVLRNHYAAKGMDYDELKRQFFKAQQMGRAERYAGLPTTEQVDPEQITPGVTQDMDQRLREMQESVFPGGPKRGMVSALSGVTNLPQVYADLENLATKAVGGVTKRFEPGGEYDTLPGEPEPAQIKYIPGFTEATELLEEQATEGASEEYKRITHPVAKGVGEFADVAIPTGAATAGLKRVSKMARMGWLDNVLDDAITVAHKGLAPDSKTLSAMRHATYNHVFDAPQYVGDDVVGRAMPVDDDVISEAGGYALQETRRRAKLDPQFQRLERMIRPQSTMSHLADEEFGFLQRLSNGDIPLTDENILKALDIEERTHRAIRAHKFFRAYEDIKTVLLTRGRAVDAVDKEKGRIFQQGYENLGVKARVLDPIGRALRHMFDNDYAVKELGRIAKDDTAYGSVRYLRDIGTIRNIPIEQGTYTRFRHESRASLYTQLSKDPIALAKYQKWFGGRMPDEMEMVPTGESLTDIFSGRWEVSESSPVATFVKEPPMPREMYSDLDLYLVSRRVTTDMKDRALDLRRAAHLEEMLKDFLRQADEIADVEQRGIVQEKLNATLRQVKEDQKYLKTSITPEDVQRHAQNIENLKVKWGSEFYRMEDKARRLTAWERRNIVDMTTEVGFMSPAVRKKVLMRNSHHAPMRMLMDTFGDPYRKSKDTGEEAAKIGGRKAQLDMQTLGRRQKGAEGVGLQAMKVGFGDDYVYVSPMEEMVRRSHEAVSFVERQRAANNLVDIMKKLQMTKKVQEPLPGITPEEASLVNYLDTMDDFHMERVNSLPGGIQPEDTIRYMNGGRVEYYKVDPDMMSAVSGMTPQELEGGMKILAGYAHMLRLGATGTPRFALKNLMRDPQSMFLFTEEGGLPWDPLLGLFHIMRRDDIAQAWQRAGGGHATQATLESNFDLLKQYGYDSLVLGRRVTETGFGKTAAKAMSGFKEGGVVGTLRGIGNVAKAPFMGGYELLRGASQLTEQASRAGHFNRLRLMRKAKASKWYDPRYAASKALKLVNDYTVGMDKAIHAFWSEGEGDRLARMMDATPSLSRAKKAFKEHKGRDFDYLSTLKAIREGTLDFHKIGTKVRWLNRARAFTAAGLQDPYKLATSFAERPFTTLMRINTSIVMPSMYFWWQHKDDPDFQEEPDWKRAMFWYVGKTEDGWIRVPKPFLPGVLFGYGAEMGLQHAWETDAVGTEEFLKSFFKSDEAAHLMEQTVTQSPLSMVGPEGMPDLISSPFQLTGNRDWFRDAPIVGRGRAEASPELQRSVYTSPSVAAATDIARPVMKKIPHTEWLQSPQQAEWLGGATFGGSSRMLLDIVDKAYRRKKGMPEDPGSPKGVLEFLGIESKQSRGFGSKSAQKFFDILSEYTQYEKDLNALDDPEEQKAFIKQHEDEFKILAKLDGHSARLSELATQRSEAYGDPELSDEKRLEELRRIDNEITAEAREALIAVGVK
jgi:hypothetical protein